MKKNTFKKQFIVSFIKILSFSLILSLLLIFTWIFTLKYIIYPANYYEQQINVINKKLNKHCTAILNKDFKPTMDDIIPSKGILYQVFNENGTILYKTLDESIVKNKKHLMNNLNCIIYLRHNNYAKILPILDSKDTFKGAVLLKYSIIQTRKTKNKILFLVYNHVIFLPFIFIIIFTLLYAKKLSKSINKPVKLLLSASEKIKNQDLDFTIKYDENNEFTALCIAFESMRINLKNSLIKQWDLEEKRRENISNIAHDLKTPLTIVNTYCEAIIDGIVDENKALNYINVIKRNNERALALIEDMNKISNIENPNFSIEFTSVNIVEFLNSKIQEYTFMCKEKHIHFQSYIEDKRISFKKQNLYIKGIEEILDNCISNSLRYTKDGDEICLYVLCKDDRIDFSIKDTGKGFSKEDLKNLFNKFYKGDKSRSFTSGHCGLGMYIAKTIAEKHGGFIEAKNNTPKGAIINFVIKPKIG